VHKVHTIYDVHKVYTVRKVHVVRKVWLTSPGSSSIRKLLQGMNPVNRVNSVNPGNHP